MRMVSFIKASGGNGYPGEKVAGTFCAKHPKGRPGKRCLPPFSQGGKFVFAARQKNLADKAPSMFVKFNKGMARDLHFVKFVSGAGTGFFLAGGC